MKFVILILLSICGLESKGQGIKKIIIIHRGEELKPIGTLLISTRTIIMPNERKLDSIFGRGIKTNKKTFRKIKHFLVRSNYLVQNPLELNGNKEFYEIKCFNGIVLYLGEKYFNVFFNEFRNLIVNYKLDFNVYEALKHYN